MLGHVNPPIRGHVASSRAVWHCQVQPGCSTEPTGHVEKIRFLSHSTNSKSQPGRVRNHLTLPPLYCLTPKTTLFREAGCRDLNVRSPQSQKWIHGPTIPGLPKQSFCLRGSQLSSREETFHHELGCCVRAAADSPRCSGLAGARLFLGWPAEAGDFPDENSLPWVSFPRCVLFPVACLSQGSAGPAPPRQGRQGQDGLTARGGGLWGSGRQALFPNQDLAGTQHQSPGPQKAVDHLPNSSFPRSAKPSGSTCLPRVPSVISCGLVLPLRLKLSQGEALCSSCWRL